MKKSLILAPVCFFAVISTIQAADIVRVYRDPESSYSSLSFVKFDGFYIGGQLGSSWAKTNMVERNLSLPNMVLKPDGFIGGLYAGYSFEIGYNSILGLDTDFLGGDVKESGERPSLGGMVKVKQSWVGSSRARAGYMFDRLLPYLAVGIAYGDIKISTSAILGANSSPMIQKTHIGWTSAIGTDYALSDNILLRLEYRYTNLGDKDYKFDSIDPLRVKYHSDDVRLAVGYKF